MTTKPVPTKVSICPACGDDAAHTAEDSSLGCPLAKRTHARRANRLARLVLAGHSVDEAYALAGGSR